MFLREKEEKRAVETVAEKITELVLSQKYYSSRFV